MKSLEKLGKSGNGFALVVTLSLMILLSILAVGLLSLSTVALRQSGHSKELAKAQANARMALIMAIGQLQETAGDDRRITVTADQLNDSADGSTSAAAEGRRFWTGVYQSWAGDTGNDPAAWPTRPTPDFKGWLVTESPGIANENTAKSVGTGDISLVGNGTVGLDPKLHVKVPLLVTMDARGGKGALAWWTGDQGVKATMALPAAKPAATLADARGASQAVATNDFENAGGSGIFQKNQLKPQGVSSLTSWNQLALVSSVPPANPKRQALFHDITAIASGLLTDVRHGGFRKDFSMALENEPTEALWGDDFFLYRFGNDTGINLKELYEYYQLPGQLEAGGKDKYAIGGSRVGADVKVLRFKATPDACMADEFYGFKNPLVVSYELLLSFEVKPRNTVFTTGTGASAKTETKSIQCLHVVADPILTFWNPLDVPISIPASAFFTFNFWAQPLTIEVTTGGVTYSCPLVGCISTYDSAFLSMQVGNDGPPIVLMPGELLKTSQIRSTQYNRFGSDRFQLQGGIGFNHGGGVSYPMREKPGPKNNGFEYVDVTGKSSLTYTIKPNKYTCGAKNGTGNVLPGYAVQSAHHSLTMIQQKLGNFDGSYSRHLAFLSLDGNNGAGRKLKSGAYSGTNGSTKRLADRYYANDPGSADVFPTIVGRTIEVGQLEAGKQPILKTSFRVKPEVASDMGSKGLQRLNPQSVFMDFYDLSDRTRNILPYEFKVQRIDSWLNNELEATPDGNAYMGGSYTPQGGVTSIITHSIPREPLISLGALQHSMANGYDRLGSDSDYRMPMLPQISHAIGNSAAPPMIAADAVKSEMAGGQALADHSYLANRRLWDDWFFSSIAPQTANSFAVADRKTQQDVAKDFFSGKSGLRNPRYKAETGGLSSDEIVNKLFASGKPRQDAHALVASLLRVDGMFNVNSTSVEAWKAVLSSLRGTSVPVQSRTGAESVVTATGVSVTDLLTPVDAVADPVESLDVRSPNQWLGRRELTDPQISELAVAIVRQVRLRGPFLSLADFVNRRVGSDKVLAVSGAIQSALDSPDVTINAAYNDRGVNGRGKAGLEFPEAESGPLSQGIPGIVKQGDILTPIAPFLSARSDTFVIRGYGESRDSQGNVTARAWCEATVERDAAFVNSAETPETALVSLSDPINRKMGRRFKLISFRWLNADEI